MLLNRNNDTNIYDNGIWTYEDGVYVYTADNKVRYRTQLLNIPENFGYAWAIPLEIEDHDYRSGKAAIVVGQGTHSVVCYKDDIQIFHHTKYNDVQLFRDNVIIAHKTVNSTYGITVDELSTYVPNTGITTNVVEGREIKRLTYNIYEDPKAVDYFSVLEGGVYSLIALNHVEDREGFHSNIAVTPVSNTPLVVVGNEIITRENGVERVIIRF